MRRGLSRSREEAKEAVLAGAVTVGGAIAEKPSRLVAPGEAVVVAAGGSPYVSRGGDKLEAALAAFGLECREKRCIDIGASTGGFTDCLLRHGAQSVVALDVGRSQLHERLRADPKVTSVEGCNIRHARLSDLGAPFDLAVADLSFISLRTVAGAISEAVGAGTTLSGPAGEAVVLVKPQFEVGRREASAGAGVIRDPRLWERVLGEVAEAFAAVGLAPAGVIASPILGAKGNAEFLCHLRARPGLDQGALGSAVAAAVAAAAGATGRR